MQQFSAALPWQPQLLGNAQLSIIHSRSLTDEERASERVPAQAVVRRREGSRWMGGGGLEGRIEKKKKKKKRPARRIKGGDAAIPDTLLNVFFFFQSLH